MSLNKGTTASRLRVVSRSTVAALPDWKPEHLLKGWQPREGFTVTQVRAISARVNQNYDGFPSDELKTAAHTFLGKPVFVNHNNDDPTRARGVVVGARYVENGDDKYIEVLQEVDRIRFPKLAKEIEDGGLDSVSMGTEAGHTICSACDNKATDLTDMCDHVLFHKGQKVAGKDGEPVLVYEKCYKLGFFELSYVFDPADETAVVSKVITSSKKTAYDEVEAPADVNTLREEDEDDDSYHHYVESPKELQDPDLDEAQRIDREQSEDPNHGTGDGVDEDGVEDSDDDGVMDNGVDVEDPLAPDLQGTQVDEHADDVYGSDTPQEYDALPDDNMGAAHEDTLGGTVDDTDQQYLPREDPFMDGTEDPRGGQDERFNEPHRPEDDERRIAGYYYQGKHYAPKAMIRQLIAQRQLTAEAATEGLDTEKLLDALAEMFGIDRHDEHSYDSAEHPKVIFEDQVDPEQDKHWLGEGKPVMEKETVVELKNDGNKHPDEETHDADAGDDSDFGGETGSDSDSDGGSVTAKYTTSAQKNRNEVRSSTMARQTLATRGATRRRAEVENDQGIHENSGEFISGTTPGEEAASGGSQMKPGHDNVSSIPGKRTDPQQASRQAFNLFAKWVKDTYGVSIQKAASDNKLRGLVKLYATKTGSNVSLLMPGMKEALRVAAVRKVAESEGDEYDPTQDDQRRDEADQGDEAGDADDSDGDDEGREESRDRDDEEGFKEGRRRKADNTEYAKPMDRVKVTNPVSDVNPERAQQDQFELGEFANNAGDDIAKPDLSTGQNWAPGEGRKESQKTSGVQAVRLADLHIAAGLADAHQRYALAANFEKVSRAFVEREIGLLERVAEAQARQRKVAGGISRSATRSALPQNFASSAPQRVAAVNDTSSDMDIFL